MACFACVFLAAVLVEQHDRTRHRWTVFLAGDPQTGARLFVQKGCGGCHSIRGRGAPGSSELCARGSPQTSLGRLVAAMWNHAPRMWAEGRSAIFLDQEDVAHLLAFLYVARYADDSGDPVAGKLLFEQKNCRRCHRAAPPCVADPVAWADSMWRHLPRMEAGETGAVLPRFEGREAGDLLASVRCASPAGPVRPLASPDRGWAVFRRAGCIGCHSIRGEGGRGRTGVDSNRGQARDFGPHGPTSLTMVRFAGLLWNHAGQVWRRPEQRPSLSGQDIADLGAFLYSLHYFEPAGSPPVGATIFSERGCARCHGVAAQGTGFGPALRGRGDGFNSVTLATALWQHGPGMYRRVHALGLPWPTLAESDIGHLVAFLNTASAQKTAR